jgi:SAM-dependent methyltransferase
MRPWARLRRGEMTASAYVPPGKVARLRRAARDRGVRRVAIAAGGWAAGYAAGLGRSLFGPRRTFSFAGGDYAYLYHRHGFTWLNERAVEVPIAARAVAQAAPGRVLEVGNVLAHYGHNDHTVVDKYEREPGVINVDALEFEAPEPYDLVVSVSTLEHIGWDETDRDPARAERAVEALARQLAPGGRLLVTLPVGYHPVLDAAVREGRVPFDTVRALRRTGRTTWEEADPADVWTAPYDHLLCAAGAVLVGSRRVPA